MVGIRAKGPEILELIIKCSFCFLKGIYTTYLGILCQAVLI